MEKVKKTVLFRVSSQGTNFTGAKYLSKRESDHETKANDNEADNRWPPFFSLVRVQVECQ